ncbi:hypothetical protein VKT23_008748 [Stygiomarasmius scandens]|uniref:Uncharacterized protein n=1 Tax=Marasmiellus scandens TaxID=2682957 RepID=A0ABR1JFH5_9AGAR
MTATASDNYALMLMPQGHGYPLWIPEPNDALPSEYRNDGVRVGDVGLITDGAFNFLFNICLEKDHPINRWHGVPQGFRPIEYNPRSTHSIPNRHRPGAPICSLGTEEFQLSAEGAAQIPGLPFGAGGGIELKFFHSQGATLMLPEGASREDYFNRDSFFKYAAENAEIWYQYANDTLGLQAGNGSLYLITGSDKAACWETVAFSNLSNAHSVSLHFTAGPWNEGKLGLARSSLLRSPVSSRCSPPSNRLKNQSVFIRGFKIMLRKGPKVRFLQSVKVTDIVGAKPSKIIHRGSVPRSRVSRGESRMDMSVQRSHDSSTNSEASDEEFLAVVEADPHERGFYTTSDSSDSDESINPIEVFHPSNIINEHMLKIHPETDIAVTHDDEWCTVLQKQDSKLPNNEELINRITEKYDFTKLTDRCVSLKLKSEPAMEVHCPHTTSMPERSESRCRGNSGANASREPRSSQSVGGMNNFPPGTKVWYWNSRGNTHYGTVVSSAMMPDRTLICNIRDDSGANLQLPAASLTKV